MNIFNLDKEIQESVKNLPNENYMLGRTLMQPFKPSNSGSRALLNSVHTEHLMVLTHGEVPLVQTGYESEFGKNSTSYVVSDGNYKVIAKIPKFTFNGNHYYLILQDVDTGVYDVVERVTYKYNTESYGYLWDNKRLDALNINDKIAKGDIVKTSIGFDAYGNKLNGVNLLTLYLASAQNMEDSVILSETAAMKLESCLIKRTSIMINDNDVLLNLYGSADGIYKTFPDIGERIVNGTFCAIRRIENRDILFSLSKQRQREINLSDRSIIIDGYVCDIDVYCNNPENLKINQYNAQLYKYYIEKMTFCQRIVDLIGPLAMNCKLSYELERLYAHCRDTIAGKEYYKDKLFNNVILDITIMQPLPMECADKLADRYGGKGVVSQIIPDELMPLLDNGRRVEVIKNQSTCINRENIGQLHEQSINFISMQIIDFIKDGINSGELTYCEAFNIWFKYVSMLDKEQALYSLTYIDNTNEDACEAYIKSMLEDDGIIVSMEPFTTNINIDTIKEIYDKFKWIKQCKVYMPIEDSNGNIRYAPAKRKLTVAKIYNYRLKQYAEEKFSATSLSATNLKGLNTRSKANKIYEAKYTKTPIMFGFMESGNLSHIGMQYVVMNLMLYSNSPMARRLFEQLLTGDPYNIDIRLDEDSKNRSAEIINVLLKTMGLRLEFIKKLKQKQYLVHNVLVEDVPNRLWSPQTNFIDLMGEFGYHEVMKTRCSVAMNNRTDPDKDLFKILLVGNTDKSGNPVYETNFNQLMEEAEKEYQAMKDLKSKLKSDTKSKS